MKQISLLLRLLQQLDVMLFPVDEQKPLKKITLKWIIYTVKKPLTSWDFVWLFLNINEKEMALDLNNLRPFFFLV